MPIIDIKEVNLITEWVYDIHNSDCCAICTNRFDEPSIESNKINICIGKCKHGYHTECIHKWISKRNTCPLCKAAWVPIKL